MKNTYRACAEINLDALKHNIQEIQAVLGDTKLMCVIKTNAYGHGSIVLARELAAMGAYGFAVATVDEGIELRNNGIIQPILVLGFVAKEQYADMITHHIMPAIFTYSMAKDFDAVASSMHTVADVHIKLDTGMNRIGFKPTQESVEIVERISKLPNIKIEGIFTHFACADEADKTSAYEQERKYDQFIKWLEEKDIYIPIKHVSNSASIIDLAGFRKDMVRSGIITYGLYPSEEVSKDVLDLKPAMELKTHIVYIKEVGPGEGISYNHTYVTDKKTKIATIPVGYADGYPRALSSKGRVLIRGQYAPIIGRICMDQFMVDVTDIEGISVMDEVTLVGHDGNKMLTVEEVANLAGSFNYEFVCGIGKRVPRVYIRNGEIKEAEYFEK